MNDYLIDLFEKSKDKRICVLGTTCTGKSTIIDSIGIGEDMDDKIFPLLSQDEIDYVCQIPWTEEIGKKMDELVRTRLSINPGVPMFGTVLLDCDLIIYLHIDDDLLKSRCLSRGVDFFNAKNMQEQIESEINNSAIEVIKVEVSNNKVK